jgi:mono/diheme cytochrome c family protein
MRIIKWILGLLLALLAILFAGIQLRWNRTFTAPTPALAATTDSAAIAQGRYLAYSAAGCAYCHLPKADWVRLDAGEQPPLSGNHIFPVPFAEIHSPNLTPDPTTGIGRRSDGEIARILRHGVRADNRAAFPFMEFQHLSDADIVALLSFLRSQAPVQNAVPDIDYNLMGKALMAFVIKPESPATPPPAATPTGATVERGAYLANSVASCVACHTNRSNTGEYIGEKFAGGQRMDIEDDPTHVFVTPNLTPDPTTGHIYSWSEDDFVARFRRGQIRPVALMPWGAFSRMTEDDLRAIYRYLRSLPPSSNLVGEVYRPKP